MSTLKRLAKGFTLIELMIVVAIIGILAAIAIPNFVKFQCRSKQSESKGNMKAFYVAEESYRSEFDSYLSCSAANCAAAGTNDIGFSPKRTKIRYSYATTSATLPTLVATSTAQTQFAGGLAADQRQLTEQNDI